MAEFDQVRDPSKSFDSVVEAVAQYNPPCVRYLGKLGKLTQWCGGGAKVPMIQFMDRVCKQYGEQKQLGEEFTTALADMVLCDTEPAIYLRIACVVTQLSRDKTVDGIAKCLVKADIDKLKSKAMKTDALNLDQTLAHVHRCVQSLIHRGELKEDLADVLFGQALCRGLLVLLKKPKALKEIGDVGTYRTVADATAKFVIDCKKHVGDARVDESTDWDTRYNGAQTAEGGADAEPPNAARASNTMLTEAELRDPDRILEARGFELGGLTFERAVGPHRGLYKIIETGLQVTLIEVEMFGTPSVQVVVPLGVFIQKWQHFKGERPVALSAVTATHQLQQVRADLCVCNGYRALVEFEREQHDSRAIAYGFYPAIVVAAEKTSPAGILKLSPCTELGRIKTQPIENGVTITVDGMELYLTPPPKPQTLDKYKEGEMMMVPYWWVNATANAELANMKIVLARKTAPVHASFPVFQNTRVIQQHERLRYFKAKAKTVALQGAKRTKLA